MQPIARKRLTVVLGTISAGAAGWVLFLLLEAVLPVPATPSHALAWVLLPPAFVVFLLVASVGNGRFLSEAIDPVAGRECRFVEVSNRALRNSVEQGLVFVLAGTTLVALRPVADLVALPALSTLFVFARATFYLGYLAESMLRAPGMSLTIMINVVMLGWCVSSLTPG